MVFVSDLDFRELLEEVISEGAAFAPQALEESFRARLQQEIEDAPLEADPEQVGKVSQQAESLNLWWPVEEYPAAEKLRREWEELVRGHSEAFPELTGYHPNEVTLQRYPPGSRATSTAGVLYSWSPPSP